MNKGCCEDTKNSLMVDFIYVDLSECERCQSSDEILDKVLRELREQIHRAGIDSILVNKIKISSDEQAKKYELVRSPTLRINGEDIEDIVNDEYEIKESYCPSCEKVTGPECYEVTGGGNECRVFEYRGKTYETIPEEMIKEAIRTVVDIEEKTTSSCCEQNITSCCRTDDACC